MTTDKNDLLCVSQFKEKVDELAKEIGCDGKGISSHNIRSSVFAYCPDTDEYFDIVAFDVSRLPGCGCWDGIQIILRKDDT